MRREKNSTKSKEDILNAAELAFSKKGVYGTRVDEIAKIAKINKRMIYEYFGCKVDLYKKVLEIVYKRIGNYGRAVLSEQDSFEAAVKKVAKFYFDYLSSNPTYVNLLQWENMNEGEYIKDVDLSSIRQPVLIQLGQILERDKQAGIIRSDVDPNQILITLLTTTFAYFSNRYTLSKVLQYDLMNEQSIIKKSEDLANMIIAYISK